MTRPYINGQKTYRCKLCRDDGRVICFHPRVQHQFVQTHEIPKNRGVGAAFACCCEAGNAWTAQHRRYDPDRYVLLHRGNAFNAQSEANLRRFIEEHSVGGVYGVSEFTGEF